MVIYMKKELTFAQHQRLKTLWDISQTESAYKDMLNEMRLLEKRYEEVIEQLDDDSRDTICDYVSLCEAMSWRILEIAAQQMVFRFEKE